MINNFDNIIGGFVRRYLQLDLHCLKFPLLIQRQRIKDNDGSYYFQTFGVTPDTYYMYLQRFNANHASQYVDIDAGVDDEPLNIALNFRLVNKLIWW